MEYKVSMLPDKGDSWQQVTSFFPSQWESKCHELGALRRVREFNGPSALIRTLLIHVLDGCSLRETVVHARQGGIADVSDVALLKRLNRAGAWFQWMAQELLNSLLPKPLHGLKIRLVDATHISEPGSTGTDWRIHYAFDMPTMHCSSVQVTDAAVGETFKNFVIAADTLYVADRGYYHPAGIAHVRRGKGHVLVRMTASGPTLYHPSGQRFDIFKHLKSLKGRRIGDWPVYFEIDSGKVAGRVCALRKSAVAAQRSLQELLYECRRKGKEPSRAAIKATQYVFVFTTVTGAVLSAGQALALYGGRWQLELVFKRLKSIMGVGHLPKQDPEGAKAWIHAKLFCAALIEALICEAERFSPWGYSLPPVAA